MENKLARLLKNTGPVRFFIPIGLALLVMGIVMLLHTPKEYSEAVGTVTNVSRYEDDGSEQYDIDFDYTVDGKQYSSTFSGLTEPCSVGDEVTVYYDPANPDSTSNTKSTGIISIAMIAAGALALAGSVWATLKAFRKDRELDERIKAAAGTDTLPVVTPIPRDQLTEYYVSHDGSTLKPGYIVEDRARNVIFEAPMTKNAMVGNRIFTFINHRTGKAAEHEVGHTVTTSYDNEFFSVSSWFKFDGKNIWDVLHERGVRIATNLTTSFPKTIYTVSLNGRFFATIETSGRYVHEEDAAEHKVNIPVGKYFYRCWTNEPDLELLFLTVFAVSETEQAVAD